LRKHYVPGKPERYRCRRGSAKTGGKPDAENTEQKPQVDSACSEKPVDINIPQPFGGFVDGVLQEKTVNAFLLLMPDGGQQRLVQTRDIIFKQSGELFRFEAGETAAQNCFPEDISGETGKKQQKKNARRLRKFKENIRRKISGKQQQDDDNSSGNAVQCCKKPQRPFQPVNAVVYYSWQLVVERRQFFMKTLKINRQSSLNYPYFFPAVNTGSGRKELKIDNGEWIIKT
jgi:hypothetical protein